MYWWRIYRRRIRHRFNSSLSARRKSPTSSLATFHLFDKEGLGTPRSVASAVAAAKIIYNMGSGALYALEGPNEPGNFPFEFGGVATTASWSAVSAFQSAYYAAVKNSSLQGANARCCIRTLAIE
jgi:hypothetical protein